MSWSLVIIFIIGPAVALLLGLISLIYWLFWNGYLLAIIPSSFIAALGVYLFSIGIISVNNLILLFIGLIVGTAASIFRSKKLLIQKNKTSQDSKE
jgi:hypothetical protein